MRKLILVVFVWAILIFPASAQELNVLKIGWEPWEPYQFETKEKQLTGIDIEITKMIAADSGYTLSYTQLPWKRTLIYLKLGRLHIVAGASRTKEREAFAYFSKPYRTEKVVLMIRKGEAGRVKGANIRELLDTGFELGIQLGYFYGEDFEKLRDDPHYKQYLQGTGRGEVRNIEKLLRKRIDGMLVDPNVGAYLAHQMGVSKKVEIHPMKILSTDIHFMFSKKSTPLEILNAFNKTILDINEKAKIDFILQKWLEKTGISEQ